MFYFQKISKAQKAATLKFYADLSAVTVKTKINFNNKKMTKFLKEIEEAPLAPFFEFEQGEPVEVLITGTKLIPLKDGEEAFYTAQVNGKEYILPNNVMLRRKLDNLVNIKGGLTPLGIECSIEFTGLTKLQGTTNKAKTFKVMA